MAKKVFIAVFAVLLSMNVFMSVPVLAQFDTAREQACAGLDFDGTGNTECDEEAGDRVDSVVASVINIASLVVGVIAVIMVVVGGLKYVTSQGDASGTASAKNTVIYAVVGLIIVVLAQTIVRFVINRATEEPAEQTSSETRTPAQNSGGGAGGSFRQ